VRLTVIAVLAALYCAANVVGYRQTYPTVAARERFAAAFGDNLALRLFYGLPHDLATVAGYAEFRLVGLLSIATSAWAVFAAVRALRGEEEAGRSELVLSGTVSRRGVVGAALAALAIECAVLWAAMAVALLLSGTTTGDLTARESLLVPVAIVAPAVLFAAVGALGSQLSATRRGALALGGGLVAVALLARITADLASGAGWLRSLTPLGWAEQLRPVTHGRTGVLVLFALATVVVAAAAVEIAARRDVGRGVLQRRGRPRSRDVLLGSAGQHSLREELPRLLVWLVGAGVFAVVLGLFARSIAEEAQRSGLHTVGGIPWTAAGYLAFSFTIFSLATALFAASHVGGVRDEESSGRLETVLARRVARRGWLAGRLLVAMGATALLALAVGVLSWVGAASQGAGVDLPTLLGAGANCIPAALLFLGLGALIFALAPRLSAGGAIALVGAAFAWELVGALLGAPGWLLGVSPFHHVAAVPVRAFDVTGAVVMTGLAAVAAALGVALFGRRDLASG
jgi:ABC-2 type transport system permease protein